MTVFERLEKLDRRWIFGFQILVFVLAILRPVGLALEVGDTTRQAFEVIDTLPPGSIVWFGVDYEPANRAEIEASAIALFRHCMQRDLRVVSGSMWAPGGTMMDSLIKIINEQFEDKVYGVDFLNLGYRPGGQVFLQQLTEDIPTAVLEIDHYGDPISQYPLAKDLNSIKDVSAIVALAIGTPGFREYIKVVTDPYDIPIVAVLPAVSIPEAMPMINSGQLAGMLGSLRGGAEYEKISNNPGKALTGMDAQSFTNLTILVFIVLGNIGYFVRRKGTESGKGGNMSV